MHFNLTRRTILTIAFCCAAGLTAILFGRHLVGGSRLARTPSMSDQPGQRLRDLDQKIKNPNLLLLRQGEFDPLVEMPGSINPGLQTLAAVSQQPSDAGSEYLYLIVQFKGAITPQQTESLEARGFEVKAYLPNNAFVVKSRRRNEALLIADQGREFRWVGTFGPALKIQPELGRMASEIASGAAPQPNDRVLISVTCFKGESAAPLRAAFAGFLDGRTQRITERFDGVVTGLIDALPSELPALITVLSNVEGVEWVERVEKERPENDFSVRIIQSGTAGTDTPLFRNGLTGQGQIIGVADTGLDTDDGQFRFGAEPAAQTLSVAASTLSLVNGALPVSITNPNNKVIAYYLLGVGNLIDLAPNPNGGKSLDPNDRPGSFYRNAVAYDDGIFHGTHVASVAAGRDYLANGSRAFPGVPDRTSNDGMAPDARIVFQDVGHPSGDLLPTIIGYGLLHQQAYDTGARIHNNSYGADPGSPYDSRAADADDVMWRLRDYLIVFSAGNSGPLSLTLTKDSKNSLLVGATDSPVNGGNAENVSFTSSHGPTLDGRIKPDLTAPGRMVAATEVLGNPSSYGSATSTTSLDAAVNPVIPNGNHSFSQLAGTSLSSPAAAGGAALVRQYFANGYYPEGRPRQADSFNPSNALVKAILLNSGRNMTGRYTADSAPSGQAAPIPSMGQGWGRMALDDSLYFAGDARELKVLADIWNGAIVSDGTRPAPNSAIQTGQTHSYQIADVNSALPLRVSLVWVDPKATPLSSVALINNLDLEVTDPLGRLFRGNANFSNGFTGVAGGSSADNRNPVEAVYIEYPVPGTYTVRVVGSNVPGNGQMGVLAQPGNQLIDSNRQGYSLIATGSFQPMSTIASVTVNGASFRPAEIAPGALASTFGYGLPTGTAIDQGVTSFPLPATIAGVSVRVDGYQAPLLYAGAGSRFGANGAFQVNYQIPFEAAPGNAYVEVLYNSQVITSEFLTISGGAGGLFTVTSDGSGQGAVLNQDSQLNSANRPETRGRVLQIYGTGSGAGLIDNATNQVGYPATGTAPPANGSKLYLTSFTPVVLIGGVAGTVEYSGLAPGFVGLWQINVRVPSTAPAGSAVLLVVTANGKTSNQVSVSLN